MVVSADSDRWQYSGLINKCHHWSSAAGREVAAGVTAVATLVTTLWRGYLAAQLGAYHW